MSDAIKNATSILLDFTWKIAGSANLAEYLVAVAALQEAAQAQAGERSCTCHPDDSPPVPCAKKYALTDCQATPPAAVPEGWKFERVSNTCIQVTHPDTSTTRLYDTGGLNNMMFYELCLAILAAQEQSK